MLETEIASIPDFLPLQVGTGNCWTAASNSNGAAVTLQKCQGLGTASQAFTFSAGAPAGVGTGALGNVKIFGNKCLDVKGGVDVSGTKLQIWTCGTANKNQQFQVSAGDSGVNTIRWANSSRCIDLTGGSESSGTPVRCESSISPFWKQTVRCSFKSGLVATETHIRNG